MVVCVQINFNNDELVRFNKGFRRGNHAQADSIPEVAAASHSHLNIALHNVVAGAMVSLPGLSKFCRDGRLSLELIGNDDEEMAAHAQRGLLWEVLSWKMEVEEPTAFDNLQSALNQANNQALIEHEMELLNGLMTIIRDTGAGLADQFNWRMVQDQLFKSGNTVVAESPDFLVLCKVIVTALGGTDGLGGGGYNHWAELKSWHECMINPKTRRVRLQVFAKLASVPAPYPRVRNAMFRLAYSGKTPSEEMILNGQVFLNTLNSLAHLDTPDMVPCLRLAEQVLYA